MTQYEPDLLWYCGVSVMVNSAVYCACLCNYREVYGTVCTTRERSARYLASLQHILTSCVWGAGRQWNRIQGKGVRAEELPSISKGPLSVVTSKQAMGFVDFITGPFGVAFLTMLTVVSVVAMYVSCRRRCCKIPVNYTPVNHGLDEEEMAFKRTMEEQHGDDIDELFNFSGQEELEFDTNDLDDIEMLQVYRSNLTRGSGKEDNKPETGLGKDYPSGVVGSGASTAGNGAANHDGHEEVEDLEAILEGGYLGEGSERAAGQERRNGTKMEGSKIISSNGNGNVRVASRLPPPV